MSYLASHNDKSAPSILHSITSTLRRFANDESGSVIILMLTLFVIMLVLGGMAVDFMQFESRRAELQSVTDRSVLSAASLSQSLDAEDLIYDYFEKAGYDASIVTPIVVEDNASSRTIGANASLDINTFYLRLIGIDQLTAPAFAEANEGVNKVEVSLVLDYSASMRGKGSTPAISEFGSGRGRIGDLQDAADAFAAELLKPEYDGRFSINIIPYAGHVNPGEDMFDYLNTADADPFYIENAAFDLGVDGPFMLEDTIFWSDDAAESFPGTYVYDRGDGAFGDGNDEDLFPITGPFDLLGDPANAAPSTIAGIDSMLFGADEIYGTSDDNLTSSGDLAGIAYRYEQTSHCVEIADADWNSSGLPSEFQDQVPSFMRYRWGGEWEFQRRVRGWGWCPNDAMRIQYAQQDAAKVDLFFDEVTTHDGTGTNIAMKWGLALLDPSTRDAFTHLNGRVDEVGDPIVPDASVGRPADWDDVTTDKILVLMTDGFITAQWRPTNETDVENLLSRTVTGNGRETETHSLTQTKAQFIAACDLAKDVTRDVEVFTVAFETDATAGALMEQCASSSAHYYAASGAGLTDAFVDIAQQITQLRLTQ